MRVCVFVRPPFPDHAPSLSQCPQLSTSVRDHRGKSFVPAKWAVLPSVQFQLRAARLGGAGPWRFGRHTPPKSQARIAEARSVELCTGAPRTHAEGAKKARGDRFRRPESTPGRLTHSLTHSLRGEKERGEEERKEKEEFFFSLSLSLAEPARRAGLSRAERREPPERGSPRLKRMERKGKEEGEEGEEEGGGETKERRQKRGEKEKERKRRREREDRKRGEKERKEKEEFSLSLSLSLSLSRRGGFSETPGAPGRTLSRRKKRAPRKRKPEAEEDGEGERGRGKRKGRKGRRREEGRQKRGDKREERKRRREREGEKEKERKRGEKERKEKEEFSLSLFFSLSLSLSQRWFLRNARRAGQDSLAQKEESPPKEEARG